MAILISNGKFVRIPGHGFATAAKVTPPTDANAALHARIVEVLRDTDGLSISEYGAWAGGNSSIFHNNDVIVLEDGRALILAVINVDLDVSEAFESVDNDYYIGYTQPTELGILDNARAFSIESKSVAYQVNRSVENSRDYAYSLEDIYELDPETGDRVYYIDLIADNIINDLSVAEISYPSYEEVTAYNIVATANEGNIPGCKYSSGINASRFDVSYSHVLTKMSNYSETDIDIGDLRAKNVRVIAYIFSSVAEVEQCLNYGDSSLLLTYQTDAEDGES